MFFISVFVSINFRRSDICCCQVRLLTELIMGLNLQIKKLQEVISLILEENIIDNDDDLNVAEEITEVFQKHIDLVDTYKILHQSTKHNNHDETSTTNDNFTVIQTDENIDQDDNYQDLLDDNVGESNIEGDHLDDKIGESNYEEDPGINIEYMETYLSENQSHDEKLFLTTEKQDCTGNFEEYENQNEGDDIFSNNLSETKVKEPEREETEHAQSYDENLFLMTEKQESTENFEEYKNQKTEDIYIFGNNSAEEKEEQRLEMGNTTLRYIKDEENLSIFKCIFCDVDFGDQWQMNEHDTKNHKLNDNYKCISCGHVSTEKKDIVQHFLIEHKNKMLFNCSICAEILMSYKEALLHMKRYHGLRLDKNTCPICMIEITNASKKMKTHMAKEHGLGKFCCEICDTKFIEETGLQFHNKRYHEDGAEKAQCFKCSKLILKSLLKQHKEEHQIAGKTVPCPTCNKLFYGDRDMKRHKWVEHRSILYKCDQCDFQTKYRENWKRHLKKHSSDQPFSCDECGKQLKSAAILKSHKLIHTGERRHVCNFCEKKFKTATNLRSHTILHTKEYVAHCEICGQNFAQRYNFKMHVKNHHPIKSSS